MDKFEKQLLGGLAAMFIIFVLSTWFCLSVISEHSHEIASGAGSLAHDFMKAAKDNK